MAVMKSNKEPVNKRKKRIELPIENVEYTFRFPGKKYFVYRWYGEYAYNETRLLIYNKTMKFYTNMTKEYFNFLVKNRLVRREAVNVMDPPEEVVVPKEIAEVSCVNEKEREEELKKVTELEGEALLDVQKRIKALRDIKTEDRLYIQRHFNYRPEMTVDRLILDFETAIKNGISDEGFGVLYTRYMRIDDALSKFLSRLGGCR